MAYLLTCNVCHRAFQTRSATKVPVHLDLETGKLCRMRITPPVKQKATARRPSWRSIKVGCVTVRIRADSWIVCDASGCEIDGDTSPSNRQAMEEAMAVATLANAAGGVGDGYWESVFPGVTQPPVPKQPPSVLPVVYWRDLKKQTFGPSWPVPDTPSLGRGYFAERGRPRRKGKYA